MPVPKSTKDKKLTSVAGGGAGKPRYDWAKHGAGTRGGDDDRPQWKAATEGDKITGLLREPIEANTRFGAKTVIELDDCRDVESGGSPVEDGNYVFWPTPACVDVLADADVAPGDWVTITLVKLVDTNKGNPFKQFEVTGTQEPF